MADRGKPERVFPCKFYRAMEKGRVMQKNLECNRKSADNSKITAVLAYLGILVLVPFFLEKKPSFVKFHVGQGITLFALEIVYGIIYRFLAMAVLMVSWRLYFIVRIIGAVALVFPVLAVIGIINVVNGQEKELPAVGKIRLVK